VQIQPVIPGIYGIDIYSTSNWLIEGNLFEFNGSDAINFAFSSSPGTIIQNNIFAGNRYKINGISNASTQRTHILNNIFISTTRKRK